MIWSAVPEVWQTDTDNYGFFCPLEFWKNEQKCWRYHHLNMRTKNCNHMRHGSWYTEWDGQNFLSFWAIFCPFTPLTNHKIKILKNERSIFRSYHFTRVYQKLRSYLWFLRYKARQTVFLSFWVIFCLWPT